MRYFYKNNGFYLQYEDMPDAVEISKAEYQDILKQQSQGLCIVPGSKGYPVAVSPESQLTPEQLQEKRKLEIALRLHELDLLAVRPMEAITLSVATEFDHEKLTKIHTEKERLRREQAELGV